MAGTGGGYGAVGTKSFNGKHSGRAHCVAYELTHGPIPSGLKVCHTCDNPPCCNPAHLFPGTDKDNSDDKIAKGRGRWARGERAAKARLTEADVRAIREAAEAGARPTDLAQQYDVSVPAICAVINRDSWRHVA